MLQSPNINIVPQNQIGDAVAQGFQALQAVNEAKILDEQEKIAKFHELADVSFTDTNIGNNTEVVEAANKYVDDLSQVAAKYKGDIPYAERAKFIRQKRDLMMLTKRAVEDEKSWHDMMVKLGTQSDKWDVEETMTKMNEIRKLPLQDRPYYYEALTPSFDPAGYLKEIMPEAATNVEARGGYHYNVTRRDPEPVIRKAYRDNPKFKRDTDKRYAEALRLDLIDEDMTPQEFAVQLYGDRFKVEKETRAGRIDVGQKPETSEFELRPVQELPPVTYPMANEEAITTQRTELETRIAEIDKTIEEKEKEIEDNKRNMVGRFFKGGTKESLAAKREELQDEVNALTEEKIQAERDLERNDPMSTVEVRQATLPASMSGRSINIPAGNAIRVNIDEDATVPTGTKTDISGTAVSGKMERVLYVKRNEVFGGDKDDWVPVIEIVTKDKGLRRAPSGVPKSVNMDYSVLVELTKPVMEAIQTALGKNMDPGFTLERIMGAIPQQESKPEPTPGPQAKPESKPNNNPLELILP
jgi:hypothetical protein